MVRKAFIVTGATGHIGGAVAEKLKAQGHEVRSVSRRAGINLDDAPALKRAFSGADSAFLLIPPEPAVADLRRRQNEVGQKLAQAAKEAGIRRVVFLSSVGAQLDSGTGPIMGLHDMEERLNAMSFAELVHLRPCFFMENHLWGLPLMAQKGIYGSVLRPDLPFPMIATRDIAEKAVELLTAEPFRQLRVRELPGPRDYTIAEVTRILGAAIGKPDLRYMQFPYDEARNAMIGDGFSASFADALVEMDRAFNEGKVHPEEKRSAENTTSTTLEQFAQEVFQKAYYEATTASAH
jgi:uncharacterized protein YbjT (DUF2867 family)